MSGGGTYTIWIKEGTVTAPTKVDVTSKPQVTQDILTKSDTAKLMAGTLGVVGTGVGLASFAINEYSSITGRQASVNAMKPAITYGSAAVGLGLALATGNVIGAGAIAVGTGLSLAKQNYEFQKGISEANAVAEYLKQQSQTSVNSNRGDYYKFTF